MQHVINFNLMMLQMLIHFQYMNQNETKNILSNANLHKKVDHCKNMKILIPYIYI